MSRIYKNMSEAVNEIERDIMEMGIQVHPDTMQNKNVKGNDDYSTIEVQNYTFSILDMSDWPSICENKEWVEAEFNERINFVENPGEAWKLRKNVWEEFLNKEGKFDYTYGERIKTQLFSIIEELIKNPDTRQTVIHIHFPEDTHNMRKKRIPCSMYYQFMIRRHKLDVIYNMRSSDFDTHFKNDIILTNLLREYIGDKIARENGILHVNIGSLHRYKNYTKKIVF